ncbi:ATP-dependent helicase [Pseudomonas aeruginosa]|uniref:DISARM system SNF2-like helicase DrmD n=1 Tax=Pseudomonas aeruginosa TaxID=287 RepID=UPI000F73E58E|nr:DISARM system SNF2-like helicase DrmD [Pseudomonas aeruginosa]MBG6574144.1 DEAD/DEAH box helicase [Pseudomonas aeruginosa]MBH9372068.1 DEAD/DEAH box helicase [Pseudomonas aeruginosa]MCO1775608.1 DEAD/DEAH box helicase [Pseudomonas aeruginosa]MCV0084147.1 DISARM system SNF2-like helicase DrmD [Pseudomonas aeruginosa]MDQ9119309.1 DISARM system SNF2-like helicase DrmD [Pseudomonas aeruginosa]
MPWSPGQLVRHIDDPAKTGTVTDQTRSRASGSQYRVNWNGRLDWHYEEELVAAESGDDDVYELLQEGHYGRVDDLRRLLTHVHLAGRLTNVVYAMGLTQTDFYPHQYKPLLTLLDSPVNGLLIADEVGLGKTIEAGLIWTELRARYDMRRLLVVCPAMLREKWRLELSSRFGLDARVVDAPELLQELESSEHRERAWIISYQGIRAPGSWDPTESDAPRRSARARLADLLYRHADREPLLDLVTFDEAHYMRNEGTGAWRTGSLLRDVSTHQVMLSATPINLGSDDLFNVLRLLDPDHFEFPDDFRNVVLANRPVIAASDVVRNPLSGAPHIVEAIRKIKSSRYFERSERVDRLIEEAEAVDEWTNERRVEFAAKIERLNLIAHIVSRTRKREVQIERVLRDVTVFEAEMSLIEVELYQSITEGTREYALMNGIEHGFLLSTPQRMVASSPAALLRTWREDMADADAMAIASDEADEDEDRIRDASSGLKRYLAGRVLREFDAGELTRQDSKFAELKDALRRFLAEGREDKALVFTTFRGTARYLVNRLSAENIEAGLLMGGEEFDKEAVVGAFREHRTCRVLVCTDVAAEGVDLQFCRLVVNYDLPWNPMRIEQRIGRIDRIGQRSNRILVWNFVHKETIDALILTRLAKRIGVFESALGETEEILGKVRCLEDVLLSKHLTADEEARLIEEVALAIENSKRKQEELEREAIQLVAHGQQLLAQIEAARGEGKAVTRHDLIRYVDGYLRTVPGCRVVAARGEPDTFDIGLSPSLAAELDEFVRKENLVGKTGLGSGQTRRCRFTDRITEKPKTGEEIVHRFHPIVRFLSHKAENCEARFPLYASQVTANGITAGRYAVMTRFASFSGVKEEEHLLVAAIPLDRDSPLDVRTAEALLDTVRKSGVDWPAVALDVSSESGMAAVERCEEMLRDRYKALKGEKQRENRDRADVLSQLLEDHVRKKRDGFEKRIAGHETFASLYGNSPDGKRRKGLANAERKKMEDFLARIETRRATLIRKSQAFSAETREVCVLLVDVVREGTGHEELEGTTTGRQTNPAG